MKLIYLEMALNAPVVDPSIPAELHSLLSFPAALAMANIFDEDHVS